MNKFTLGLIAAVLVTSPVFAQDLTSAEISNLSNIKYKIEPLAFPSDTPLVLGLGSLINTPFFRQNVGTLGSLNIAMMEKTIWQAGVQSYAIPIVRSNKTLVVSIKAGNPGLLDMAVVDNNQIISPLTVNNDVHKIGNRVLSVARPADTLLQDRLSQAINPVGCFSSCFKAAGDKLRRTWTGAVQWYANPKLSVGATAECGIRCSPLNPLPGMSPDELVVQDQIREGLILAMGARQSVTDNAINGQNFISGWTTPSPTDNVQSVGINPVNGEVTITFSNKVFPPSGKTLVLSPRDGGNTGRNLQPGSPPTTGQITWNCNAIDQNSSTHPGNKGTIQGKYLLANCPETGMLVSEVFVKRSLVTEGLGLAAGAKASVADNAINGQAFASGWTPPSATDIVSSVIIDPGNGEITITYTDKVAPAGANTLILSPIDGGNTGINLSLGSPPASGAITWYCNSAEQSGSWTHLGNKGSISGNYVPANCR